MLDDDQACIAKIRDMIERLPISSRDVALFASDIGAENQRTGKAKSGETPGKTKGKSSRSESGADALYDLLPADHRMSYDMHDVLRVILDNGEIDEFQESIAREMICGDARIDGITVGVIANQRGLMKAREGEKPRFGGIVYTESAEKVAYFIDRCDRLGIPLLFVQDVSGFMVGTEAEQEGIIRAGARFVEAMATARVPKIVLTVNHASGAGYYAMAGQGFDPDFILSWPTGRMGVMEGESAIQAVHGPALLAAKKTGKGTSPEVTAAVDEMRADYEHQLDARYAAARGYVDAIVFPENTREMLSLALRATLHNPGPHLGPFVLPPHLGETS
jgi:3-methylcrotonyl-CoA carboxylase beta subunit